MDQVASITIPGVFKDLAILGNIGDKQALYRQRIINGGKAADDESVKGPCYYLSEPGTIRIRDDVFAKGENEQILEFVSVDDCKVGKRALPAFFETRYIFRAQCADEVKDVRVYHRLAQVTEGFTFAGGWLFGDIDFINTPGRFTLALDVTFKDGTSRRISFKFTVVSVKMDVESDYKEILKVIENERPGLVQNFLSKTFGDSGFDPKGDSSMPSWYAILESIFDFYVDAAKQIIHNPHRRYESVAEWRRPDQIKRWSPRLVNRYASTPRDRSESSWFRVERVDAETDTSENRFVLHTLRDISRQLKAFAEAYRGNRAVSRECLAGVEKQAKQLDELAGHPFFHGVGRYKWGAAQSLVLQKRAGYAQILTAWLKLKQALSPSGEGVDVGYRPLSALYEFWTFLATRKILDRYLVEENGYEKIEDPKIADLARLLDSDEESASSADKSLCRMGYRYVKGDRTILLAYQQTYGTDETGENFAVTYDQRPDIVLSIREGADENVYTYLFDAKYRVEELGGKDASPRDAIDDMHRYRDAILYRRQKAGLSREIIGAYVLFPGRLGQSYDYASMLDSENIGAFPLLPKPSYETEFGKFIICLLEKDGKKAHLALAMPPRGTEISLEPVVTEEQVYDFDVTDRPNYWGSVSSKCYDPIEKRYVLPVPALKDGRRPEDIKRIQLTECSAPVHLLNVVEYIGTANGNDSWVKTVGFQMGKQEEYWLFAVSGRRPQGN